MASRPLFVPAPALVKVRWGLPKETGLSRSTRSPRISCTQGFPDSRGSALEISEHTNSDADKEEEEEDSLGWSQDEMDAISALFDRPMRQKRTLNPAKRKQGRALPLPLPHKTRLPIAPSPKQHIRRRSSSTSRLPLSEQVRKNPEFLIGLAREIAALPADRDVAGVLDPWARFLRKGSLSMTIRELGHMGLPERALQTLCWAQKQSPTMLLFPDDRTLASAVEVLARFDKLKKVETAALEECVVPTASRSVLEAVARGFIRAGNVGLTRKLLELARASGRTLDISVHVKLMAEAARTPEGYGLAAALLDELGKRPGLHDLLLRPRDCTAVLKVCVKLRRYAAVESLFAWFSSSDGGGVGSGDPQRQPQPTVVMYTTVIHSRCRDGRLREAMALAWEMERRCVLDLPAYRVVVRLCVALGDMDRAIRYLARLKEAGFVPTADMYDNLIGGYMESGRMARCRQLVREAESAGLKLDKRLLAQLSRENFKAGGSCTR